MLTAFQLADTDPRVMDVWVEYLRKLTPGDKFQLVMELNESMHLSAVMQIRKERPGISETDLLRELATRRYGRELAEKVYPRAQAA